MVTHDNVAEAVGEVLQAVNAEEVGEEKVVVAIVDLAIAVATDPEASGTASITAVRIVDRRGLVAIDGCGGGDLCMVVNVVVDRGVGVDDDVVSGLVVGWGRREKHGFGAPSCPGPDHTGTFGA